MALSDNTILIMEIILVIIIVLMIFTIIGVIGFLLYRSVKRYLGFSIPINAPIGKNFCPKFTQGHASLLLVEKTPSKYGRIRLKCMTLDVPYDSFGRPGPVKEVVFCVKESQLKMLPIGVLSSYRATFDILPLTASDLPESLRNDPVGRLYALAIAGTTIIDNAVIAINKSLDETTRAFKKYDKSEILENIREELTNQLKMLSQQNDKYRREVITLDPTKTEDKK